VFDIPADLIFAGLFPHKIPHEYRIHKEIEQAMKPVGASGTYKFYMIHL
jgi:hypothetical protein